MELLKSDVCCLIHLHPSISQTHHLHSFFSQTGAQHERYKLVKEQIFTFWSFTSLVHFLFICFFGHVFTITNSSWHSFYVQDAHLDVPAFVALCTALYTFCKVAPCVSVKAPFSSHRCICRSFDCIYRSFEGSRWVFNFSFVILTTVHLSLMFLWALANSLAYLFSATLWEWPNTSWTLFFKTRSLAPLCVATQDIACFEPPLDDLRKGESVGLGQSGDNLLQSLYEYSRVAQTDGAVSIFWDCARTGVRGMHPTYVHSSWCFTVIAILPHLSPPFPSKVSRPSPPDIFCVGMWCAFLSFLLASCGSLLPFLHWQLEGMIACS